MGLPLDFEAFALLRDRQLDWAHGAALIARDADPTVTPARIAAAFDALAAPLQGMGLETLPVPEQAERLAAHLAEGERFVGNLSGYEAVENSYIQHVLARRTGIPITLCLVYREVATRVGIQARGVGFPGHFLLRIDGSATCEGETVIVDPFHEGRILDGSDLKRLLKRAVGDRELSDAWLAPANVRMTLARMLTNVKRVHLAQGRIREALVAAHRIAELYPDAASALRERAELAGRAGAHEIARQDLTRVLALDPDASDAAELRSQLASLPPTVLH